MKKNNNDGFAVIEFIIVLVILAVIGFVGFKLLGSKKQDSKSGTGNSAMAGDNKTGQSDENTPPMLAKNIGFAFDTYNPATKRAGDLVFDDIPALSDPLLGNRIWQDYGIPDNKPGSDQKNPQTVFILPAGTKIIAMVDGEVVGLTSFGANDYGIMIAKDKGNKWRYEHEHISNPKVKLGDKVKAGDVIAEVGAHTNSYQYAGYGQFEIGLYRPHSNGVGGYEDCVFKFLDPAVKKDIQAKVSTFYKAWEEFRGDTSIYDEASYASPGCGMEETISWEKPMKVGP